MIFITSRITRLDSNHSLLSTHGSSFHVRFPVFVLMQRLQHFYLGCRTEIWFFILDLLTPADVVFLSLKECADLSQI